MSLVDWAAMASDQCPLEMSAVRCRVWAVWNRYAHHSRPSKIDEVMSKYECGVDSPPVQLTSYVQASGTLGVVLVDI